MRLNIGNRLWCHLGHRLGFTDHPRLAVNAGGHKADFGGAVVVDRRPSNDRVDQIAIGDRRRPGLEQDDSHAAAANRSLRIGGEGPAVPIWRKDHARLIQIPLRLGKLEGHAARERHITLTRNQALAGYVNGNQRGRAGGLHRHTRPGQVQFVRDARSQEIGTVAQEDLIRPG